MAIPRDTDRSIIVVLSETDYVRCSYAPETHELMSSPGIWIVSETLDAKASKNPLVARLRRSSLLKSGNVLVQVPHDRDAYELAEEAQERIAQRKHLIFAELCRLLGATLVRLNFLESEGAEGEIRVDGSASYKVAHGSSSAQLKRTEKMFSELTLEDEYDGMPPDMECADELLERTGLFDDPHLASFVTARRSGNSLISRRYAVDLSRETTKTMRLTAQLKGLAVVKFDLSGLKSDSFNQKYHATYDVSFKQPRPDGAPVKRQGS